MTRIAFIKGNKLDIWPLFAKAKLLWADISKNLENTGYESRIFSFSEIPEEKELINFFNYQADSIIFIDNDYFPLEIIRLIKARSPEAKILITLFGNINFELHKWNAVFTEAEHSKTRFLVASSAHKGILSNFIQKELIDIIPYPIDTKIFHPEDKPQIERENFKLIYVGRITKPKNIDTLLKLVLQANMVLKKKIELTLIGSYPSTDAIEHLGTQYDTNHFKDKILKLIHQSKGLIKHIGFCEHENLVQKLQDSDGFISLSLNCNEEYGGAPREALATGLKVLLTDWGGHKDLKGMPGVELIPTKFDNGLPSFDSRVALKKLFAFTQTQSSSSQKNEIANAAVDEFSLNSIENELLRLLKSESFIPFILEKNNIEKYLAEFNATNFHPFFEKENGKIIGRNVFTNLYQSYISN